MDQQMIPYFCHEGEMARAERTINYDGVLNKLRKEPHRRRYAVCVALCLWPLFGPVWPSTALCVYLSTCAVKTLLRCFYGLV